jgi:hypothetical protein
MLKNQAKRKLPGYSAMKTTTLPAPCPDGSGSNPVSGHSSTNHTLPPAPRSVLLQDYNSNNTFREGLKPPRSAFVQFSVPSCYFSHMAPNICLNNRFQWQFVCSWSSWLIMRFASILFSENVVWEVKMYMKRPHKLEYVELNGTEKASDSVQPQFLCSSSSCIKYNNEFLEQLNNCQMT